MSKLTTQVNQNSRGRPFLKWAGGKTQLISELSSYIPYCYATYMEPFIGGGAFFFHLNPSQAIISDANEELIITYQEIKNSVQDVINILKTYKNEELFFYKIRQLNPTTLSRQERAARLIYLNKTCFNGLYRVNKKGEYNVPYGKRKTDFLNEDTLKQASFILKNTQIVYGDYLDTLKKYAQKDDFIFLDPPYFPVGKFADFKRYTKDFFYQEDHIKLKVEFDRLAELGCNILLTNSDHPFILDLYKEYDIKIVDARRSISRNPASRTGRDVIISQKNK